MYFFTENLKRSLDRIVEYPLTIIEAGSGCGKSTAVNEYFLKQFCGKYRQFYYTCLGENPENTWKGICNEFSKIDCQIAQYLRSIRQPDKEVLESIAAQLRYICCEEPTVFCIDNYQLFKVSDKDRLAQALSLHHCDNLHIVIIMQPYEHNLNNYSIQFPFYYISSEVFYFTKADIGNYFKEEGICLKEEEVSAIWRVTEGYVAALQLQLESWKQHGRFEISSQISVLMERTLWRRLYGEEKKWLLCLSTVDTFTISEGIEICKAQVTQEEFKGFLEKIGFIRLDVRTRRYLFHHLLLTFVREKFHDLSREEQNIIYRQAAKAAERNGERLLAAEMYGKCGDIKAFTEIAFDKDDRVELVRMENGGFVKQLIQPEHRHLLLKSPELALSLTLELYVQGKVMLHLQYLEVVKEIIKKLEGYGQRRKAEVMGEFCLLESFLVYNNVKEMCKFHRLAWNYMKRPTQLYSLNTAWTFGMPSVVGMFWRDVGKLDQVYQEVKEGMPLYYQLSSGNGMGAHHAMEGEIALLRGNDKRAEAFYKKALYDAERFEQDSICYCAYLGMARIAILRGSVATYAHMQENIDDRPYLGKEASCVFTTDVCKGYLAVLLEQFQDVPDWLSNIEDIGKRTLMPALPFVRTIYARLLLEQMRKRTVTYEKFVEEMYKWIEECRQFHMLLPEVCAWIYLSAGADMAGYRGDAIEKLRKALGLCVEDGLLFPFAENYRLLKSLMEEIMWHGENQTTKQEIIRLGERFLKGRQLILAAVNISDKKLTLRELEIAGLLKNRLSVKEIAARLCISPSTVSNIMQNIYSKLGIHSKRELYYREDI